MKATEASRISLEGQLEPLVTREIAGIAAIDAAIAHESAPDYVVMFQDAKGGKQASVEQMSALIRMLGGTPDERGGVRKMFAQTQAGIASRVSTTRTLQTMRGAEMELVTLYAESVLRRFRSARMYALSSRSARQVRRVGTLRSPPLHLPLRGVS